jgi:hypothetical protein
MYFIRKIYTLKYNILYDQVFSSKSFGYFEILTGIRDIYYGPGSGHTVGQRILVGIKI